MPSKPLIIGHRGASTHAPENTMAAFRFALQAGADGIEFDVRLTRDHVPVVIHDESLRRTGGIAKRVSALSLDDLQKIDVGSWFGPNTTEEFTGERVPTLPQVFKLLEPTDALLYLELKCDALERDLLARICCETLRGSVLKQRVIVECFDLAGIVAVKKIDPEIRTAALFEPGFGISRWLGSGRKLVDEALAAGANEIALHYRLATERVIDTARDAGLTVVVWAVDDPAWVKLAASNGIAALITNDPKKMVRRRDEEDLD